MTQEEEWNKMGWSEVQLIERTKYMELAEGHFEEMHEHAYEEMRIDSTLEDFILEVGDAAISEYAYQQKQGIPQYMVEEHARAVVIRMVDEKAEEYGVQYN